MPIVVQQPGCEKVTQSRSYIWMPDEGVILSLLELSSFSLFSTSWESQCIAVCSTRLLSTWSTAVHQSQTFPADVIYGQPLDITWPYHVPGSAVSSPDRTTLPAQQFHHLTVPRYRLSTSGRRAFSVAGPTVWNWLPDSLRDPALSSNSFRQSLQTNLFRCYQCHSAHTAQ